MRNNICDAGDGIDRVRLCFEGLTQTCVAGA